MRKRSLSMVLAFVMCLSLVTVATPKAGAATGGHTQAEAVAWANSQVGQSLDIDGQYGAQCVDFVCYYYQYLGQAIPWGNANQYLNGGAFTPSGWSYQNSPQAGDIAVSTSGQYGHVAIVTEIRGSQYVVVEQNYNSRQYVSPRLCNAGAFSKFIRPDFPSIPMVVSFDTYSTPSMNVGETNFGVWFSNPSGSTLSAVGFEISVNGGNFIPYTTAQNVGWTRTHLECSLSNFVTPSASTYKVRGFATTGGETYRSDTYTIDLNSPIKFDSLEGSCKVADHSAITSSVWVSNSAGTISSIGFCYGTSKDNMSQVEVTKNVGWTRFQLQYSLSDYIGELNSGTCYYYMFYVTTNGKTYFSDIDGFKTTGTANADVHTHSLTKTAAKAATCTADGSKEYWTCSGCGKVFSDAKGTNETTVSAMTIKSLGHSYSNGVCTRCGEKDSNYTEPVVTPAPVLTAQPQDVTVAKAGDKAVFTVAAQGAT